MSLKSKILIVTFYRDADKENHKPLSGYNYNVFS